MAIGTKFILGFCNCPCRSYIAIRTCDGYIKRYHRGHTSRLEVNTDRFINYDKNSWCRHCGERRPKGNRCDECGSKMRNHSHDKKKRVHRY